LTLCVILFGQMGNRSVGGKETWFLSHLQTNWRWSTVAS
jgi:hypothetical protein